MPSMSHVPYPAHFFLCAFLGAAGILSSQEFDSPVRFTEAREHRLRETVRLTGTVVASRISVVATEVAGVVDQLLVRGAFS